jgi:gliding motility-associated-like protein
MKLKSIRKFLFLSGFLFSSAVGLRAQNVLDNSVYRVTAYKRGNTAITSTSNYAEVIPPVSIYIPSAFTPNGDGMNDTFGVKGEGISDFRILVYDRWGEVIFESTEAKKQWDGKYKGRPVEQGNYVYQLFASGVNSRGKTGSVTVIY